MTSAQEIRDFPICGARSCSPRRWACRAACGDAISQVLQLDDAERTHLVDLARGASGTRRARRTPVPVPATLQPLLDAMTEAPAVVETGTLDIAAANALGRALYRPVLESQETPNRARYVYLDPDAWIISPALA